MLNQVSVLNTVVRLIFSHLVGLTTKTSQELWKLSHVALYQRITINVQKSKKKFVPLVLYPQFLKPTSFAIYREEEIRNFFSHEIISTAGSGSQLILEARWGRSWRTNLWESTTIDSSQRNWSAKIFRSHIVTRSWTNQIHFVGGGVHHKDPSFYL